MVRVVSGRCKFAERTFLGFMKWTLGWRFGNSTCKGKIVSLYGFYGEVTSLPKREIMALSSSLLSFHFRSSIFHFDFDPFFLFLFIASNLRVYSTLISALCQPCYLYQYHQPQPPQPMVPCNTLYYHLIPTPPNFPPFLCSTHTTPSTIPWRLYII